MAISTADELLALFLGDQDLVNLLGSYQFDGGSSGQAIAVLGSMQAVEGVVSTSGLEVIIPRTPQTQSISTLGDCGIVEKRFKIYLIEYKGGPSGAAVAAADLLLSRVPGSDYSVVTSGSISTAGLEQICVNLPPFAEWV